jgi:hypothetical protein
MHDIRIYLEDELCQTVEQVRNIKKEKYHFLICLQLCVSHSF